MQLHRVRVIVQCCRMHRVTFLALFAAAWLAGSRPEAALAIATWAAAVAISRCLMGRHFLADVLAGLLVGIMTTAVVTKVGAISGMPDAESVQFCSASSSQ